MTITQARRARRLRRPKWLSARVVGGVLLLVGSIGIGAKVVSSASETVPVWAVVRDLASGSVLERSDLVAVDVNLGDSDTHYVLASGAAPTGMLNRAMSAGELLPAAALGVVGDARVVSVPVAAEHLAPGVAHGATVDLYLIHGRAGLVGDEVRTELVLGGVTIQSILAPASGGLSGAVSSRYQVALLLPPNEASALVKQLPTGEPVIVMHTATKAGDLGDG